MDSYKVDYSELITALQNYERGATNRILDELLLRLKKYLIVTCNASPEQAEESVQGAFVDAYEQIMADEISNNKTIYKYLLQACSRRHIRRMKRQDRVISTSPDALDLRAAPPQQIENLMDNKHQKILEVCLQKLRQKSRTYIRYIMNHPEATTKMLSAHFDISEANVRVKKSRIIDDLNHCVKKKWNR